MQLVEEQLKKRLKKIAGGLDVRRPRFNPAPGAAGAADFQNPFAPDLLALVRLGATEQIIRLVVPGAGGQPGFLTEMIFEIGQVGEVHSSLVEAVSLPARPPALRPRSAVPAQFQNYSIHRPTQP